MSFDQLDRGAGQVLPKPGREIIRDPNRFTAPQQLFHEVRADEARTTSYQVFRQALPL